MRPRVPPLGPEYLRKHLGHEVKYLAFATAQFRRPEARRYEVALHDSALIRARTLLDFLTGNQKGNTVSIHDFLDDALGKPPTCEIARLWFGFISGRLAHIGTNSENIDDFDQWPDRARGVEKGDDRLDRLTVLVLMLLRDRAKYVRADCNDSLEEIAQRAEEYLADPTEDRFHAMDPANL